MAGTVPASSSSSASSTAASLVFAAVTSVAVLVVATATGWWHHVGIAPGWMSVQISIPEDRGLKCRRSCCPEIIDVSKVVLMGKDATNAGANARPSFPSFTSSPPLPVLDACDLFSESYETARDRFRSAARRVPGARLVALPVVARSASDPTQEDSAYTMDVAILPGSAAGGGGNVVIHTSGVHGVEGYAGSAIQLAFLKMMEAAPVPHQGSTAQSNGNAKEEALDQNLRRPTVLLIHAFNPFGMAHFRRSNENNVDLNRNGLRDFSLLGEESQNPSQESNRQMRYDRFRFLFSPELRMTSRSSDSTKVALVGAWLGLRQWLAFAVAFVRYGIPHLKEAMVSGQYHHSTGIFYGGDRVQSSFKVLEDWLVSELLSAQPPLHTDTPKGSTAGNSMKPNSMKVTWIDVHTGLGPSGEDTILPCHATPTSPGESQRRRPESTLVQWFPRSHHPGRSVAGARVRSGYDRIKGQVGDYFASTFRPYVEDNGLMFLVQEIGTISSSRVGHALIVENALYHHLRATSRTVGDDGSELDEFRDLMSRAWLGPAFYPDRAPWRAAVVSRGIDVLLQAIRQTSTTSS